MVTETDAWDAPPSISLPERNSASRNTPAARPRTTTDSPPGGRRLPTVLSSKSASVTHWSPTRAATTAALIKGTGGPSPEYQSDQRRSSSSSNFSLPITGPPDRPTALVGLADGRTGGRRSAPEVAPVRSTNVRRSMVTMSAALWALSTPLGAQTRGAWTLGFAGTLGGGWQVEAADVGYARAVRAGPLRVASLTARLGSFIDEGAIIGGGRGVAVWPAPGGPPGRLPPPRPRHPTGQSGGGGGSHRRGPRPPPAR